MQQLVNLTVSGIVTGAIFALIAASLTLSYATTGIFNFAYGAVAFTTGFLYYELHTALGWPIVLSAAIAVFVFAPLLGAVLNLAVLRPLGRAGDAAKVMGTVGLLIALPALCRFVARRAIDWFGWEISDGSLVQAQAGIWRTPPTSWFLGDLRVTSNDVVMMSCAAVAAVALYGLLQWTRIGLAMRAVVDRPELAGLRSIDERRTSLVSWTVGCTLAGVAGVAGAPFFGPLEAGRYTEFTLIAAAAAVIGRLRSIPVAVAAGVGIGVLKNLVASYAGFADGIQGFENGVPFAVMLLGLLLLGRDRSRKGGTVAETVLVDNHADDLPMWRQRLPWVVAAGGLAILTATTLDEFWLDTVAFGLAMALVFLSFVIVTGFGGMVSLAQATFVSTGGLVTGLLVERYDLPFLVALIGGALVAVVLGVIVALPSLRIGGLALALATLALALLGDSVLFQWDFLRNGQQGWRVEAPAFGPLDSGDPRTMTFLLAAVVGVAVVLVLRVRTSQLGRAIAAVRDSEVAAVAAGISVVRTKLVLFAISAGFAGVGGALLAAQQGNINNVTFPASLGLVWLATTVLFGIRRPAGAVVAALVSAVSAVWLRGGWTLPAVVPSWLDWGGAGDDWSDVSAILFGLGAVQLAREPDGILAVMSAAGRRRRARGRPPTGISPAPSTPGAPDPEAEARVQLRAGGVGGKPVLAVERLRAGYGPVEVLHGVDLVVRPGSVHAVLGPNGSGKTTLALAIAGAISDMTGLIRVDGVDVTREPRWQRGSRGLILAPESRGVFPGLSVDDNLAILLPGRSARAAVYERFPVLGDRRSAPAGSLSGGEQQILTLAPLLLEPPRVLVLDEPSLGLAPRIVEEVARLVADLRTAGTAVLYAEEKVNALLSVADDVSVLQLGHVVWRGTPATLDDEVLAEAYLGRGRAEPDGEVSR